MTLEEAQYCHLTNNVAVKALIGNRLFPNVIPQKTKMPAAAYQTISGPREKTHDGREGLRFKRIQYTCQGSTYREVRTLAEAIGDALNGYRGDMNGLAVQECSIVNEVDGYAETPENQVVRIDATFLYRDA